MVRGLALLLVAIVVALSAGGIAADSPTPTPSPTAVPRMVPPPTRQPLQLPGGTGAEIDDQAARGAQVYSMYCITCHGDRGQGLAEWRLTWDPEHQNCSAPNCHGRNHPPDGFYLPNNYAPAIAGTGALARFRTASDVYAFISTKMPYQEPGTRSADQYWALTAFIMRLNGIQPPGMQVNEKNAGEIQLHPELTPPVQPAPSVESTSPVVPVAVIGAATVLIALLTAFVWRRRRF